ncbi:MAG TPA: hypothetical protein VMT52_12860 [Planctomycetota bacterium]|nr:hypothetical protein [Planctomycetota bacterium]
MRRLHGSLIIATLSALPALVAEDRPFDPGTFEGGLLWRTDLEAARRDASAGKKPLLVVFR